MTLPAPGSRERPLRIAVVGSSASYMVVPRPGPEDRSYGQLLPDLLVERGVWSRATHSSRWFGMIHQVRDRYEAIRNTMPDVVVINFGMAECQPRVVPSWLMGHLTTWNRSMHPAALAYRAHVAGPAWQQLRELQRRVAVRDDRTHRLSPDRFAREIQALVRLLRAEVRPLVLVLDIDPPGSRVLRWLPGLDRRVDRFNNVIHRAVTELGDDEVRAIPASRTVDGDVDDLLPDGFHRNAEGHRRTATLLADEVCGWVGPHTGERE